jgi:hypothetical protein
MENNLKLNFIESQQTFSIIYYIPGRNIIDPDEKSMNTAAANTEQNMQFYIFVVVLFDMGIKALHCIYNNSLCLSIFIYIHKKDSISYLILVYITYFYSHLETDDDEM